ncbi:hypothetical protein DVH24_039945 [Malus domestica]|uniref:Subtilisin-like protease fibronectin type-III domain-containing protein n=1 Tax=Malus domestica TaxID=3750 RepID=A0A498I713_MALDO|nr:hypothetical protein DVH24_039945 [Malus domestica]
MGYVDITSLLQTQKSGKVGGVRAWKTDPFGEPIFAEGAGLKLADPFDYGGGLVNPNKAAYPGLIYDMDKNDYISYLCAFGYNSSTVSLLVENATSCPVPNS